MLIQLIPRFVMTVAAFSADDPRSGNRQTRFQLDAYLRVPATRPNMRVSPTLRPQRYLLALQPPNGAELRPLPEALAELWRRNQIADHQLPAVLHAIEAKLTRADFRILLVAWPLKLFAVIAAALLGAVGVLSASLAPQEPLLHGPMYAAFALAAVVPSILIAIAVRRRRLRTRQMQSLLKLAAEAPSRVTPPV